MSLPPALLERLKRRKIIRDAEEKSANPRKTSRDTPHAGYYHGETSHQPVTAGQSEQGEEEILAADYSDEGESGKDGDKLDCSSDSEHSDEETLDTRPDAKEVRQGEDDERRTDEVNRADPFGETECFLGCPNKYNIYHTCSRYCRDQHEEGMELEPTKEKRKLLAHILQAFPLPNEWKVVYDPGVKTFYFWSVMSNQVSWYPPGMGAFACPSADCIRSMMKLDRTLLETSKRADYAASNAQG